MAQIFSYHQDPTEIENILLDLPIVFSKRFMIEDKAIKKARIYFIVCGL